ncbi:hypothetical protein RJ640_010474 [Escallonia rubra]|uniref:NB-ARC domain-containing protein n=1 Tax=Escallonia rubra TaxID=112253 RepID=A0AA88UHL8_9ASTE|nr:hypothetical protein RJ640_010474 [Escallonia rubra]
MWVTNVRELAYDTGDVLENYIFWVASNERGGFRDILERYVYFLNECISLHQAKLELHAIKFIISELTSRLQNLWDAVFIRRSDPKAQPYRFESTLTVLNNGLEELKSWRIFVGFQHDEYLVCASNTVLTDGSSVPGLVGNGTVFCPVPQWRSEDWYRDRRRFDPDISEVLDDLWSKDAWDCLKVAFPVGSISKLVLTSRNTEVASHVDPKGLLHQPRCLDDDENLEDVDKMRKRGREMVKHCGGLPLAIIVLGGLLQTKLSFRE